MHLAVIDDGTLEYEINGTGEPVVLVHGGLLADENRPLVTEPALTGRYRVVNYHRRGFGASTRAARPVGIRDHAADLLALARHLDLGPVHLVGHSLGGAVALQAACDDPAAVRSLTLLEPALMGQIAKAGATGDPHAAASQEQFRRAFAEVTALARAGDPRGALLLFLRSRAGEAFRGVLDHLTASGELDRAVADADTFLGQEMPASFAWDFTAADAARIRVPVLSVLGSRSPQRARRVHRVLTRWLPQTRLLVLPDAEHALPLLDPPGLAAGIADFLDTAPGETAPRDTAPRETALGETAPLGTAPPDTALVETAARDGAAGDAAAGDTVLGGATPAKGRVVFLVRVRAGAGARFLDAYRRVRAAVAAGVPGHLHDQVCASPQDPRQWLITSEWRTLQDFLDWEASPAHQELVRPLRACVASARSLRFEVRDETFGAAVPSATAPRAA